MQLNDTINHKLNHTLIKIPQRSASQYCRIPSHDPAQISMNKQTDEQLMTAFCQHDAQAFNVLYKRHKNSMYRYYLRHVSNENIAQELFQDLWLKVINSKKRYKNSAPFTAWLFTLAHHRLVDWYRRNHLENSAFEHNIDHDSKEHQQSQGVINWNPEDELLTKKLGKRLKKAIKDLPFAQREVFLLHQEASLTLPQIANMMDEGIEKIKSRYRYAIQKLRTSLEDLK